MTLVFIELNELNFDYVKKYIHDLKLNNFKTILSNYSETVSENKYELLEPWIQWYSMHTGLKADEHKVFRLGDCVDSDIPQIFEEVEKKGFSVGMISSMNSKNRCKQAKYYIPDPWTNLESDNSWLSKTITQVFRDFVNNNASGKIKISSYINLITVSLVTLRVKSYYDFFKLIIFSLKQRWKRAILLDFLINEIHLYYLKKFNTNYSTFFLNGAAHIQHHYFLNSRANINNLTKNPKNIVKNYQDPFGEILKYYDNIIGDYIKNNSWNLVIATGLTQKIVKEKKYYYRLIDHENFLKNFNIIFKKVLPRMSRDFLITFENNLDRDSCHEKLNKLKLNNIKLFDILDKRKKSIFVTLTYNKEVCETDLLLLDKEDTKIKFKDHVAFVAIKNGEHDAKGFLYSQGKISKYMPNSSEIINITEIKSKIEVFFDSERKN